MQDYSENNLQLIQQRWPEICAKVECSDEPASVEYIEAAESPTLLVNGIHLSSCFDRVGEAQLQADQLPQTAQSVWLYGVGCGDLQCELLRRESLRQLDVVILSLPLLKSVLRHFDHRQWLGDQRVRLHLARSLDDIRTPFAVAPACLRIVDDEAARLRDLLVLELETRHINARVRSNPQFLQQIEENVALVASDASVEALFGTRRGARFHVAAAGPTLSDHYQRLRERDSNTLLIAVDAALKPLVREGIIPDIVVTIDGVRDHIMALFDLDLTPFATTPLVYFPIVHRDVLQRWPGLRYAAYGSSPLYESLLQQHPKGLLYAAGTVLHAAVDLAVKMGGSEIVMMGTDFSFPGRRSHVANAVFCAAVTQDANQEWVVDGNGEQVLTSKNLRGYLRDLERYIAQHPQVRFINSSRAGALIAGANYLDAL